MNKKIASTILCFLCVSAVYAAPLSEKKFSQDMAYYQKTARSKNLNANDRLYILDKLRKKYADAEFDLSALYSEIDRWYGEKLKESPKKSTAQEETAAAAPAKSKAGELTRALVSGTDSFSRLILDVSDSTEFKEELKKDSEGKNAPVLLIYLYNTREKLKPSSKNFVVKSGAIRQVQSQTISSKPPVTKVSVALREEHPYSVSKVNGQVILTVEKRTAAPEEAAVPTPAEAVVSAPETTPPPAAAEAEVSVSSPVLSVTVVGAVKNQGKIDIHEGTRLLETIYKAGGFEPNARMDKVRLVRKDQGRKISSEINVDDILKGNTEKDLVLKPEDLIVVPEKKNIKDKVLNGKVVPWATFFISMSLVLALLI